MHRANVTYTIVLHGEPLANKLVEARFARITLGLTHNKNVHKGLCTPSLDNGAMLNKKRNLAETGKVTMHACDRLTCASMLW